MGRGILLCRFRRRRRAGSSFFFIFIVFTSFWKSFLGLCAGLEVFVSFGGVCRLESNAEMDRRRGHPLVVFFLASFLHRAAGVHQRASKAVENSEVFFYALAKSSL